MEFIFPKGLGAVSLARGFDIHFAVHLQPVFVNAKPQHQFFDPATIAERNRWRDSGPPIVERSSNSDGGSRRVVAWEIYSNIRL
jgi:hypothetical protein